MPLDSLPPAASISLINLASVYVEIRRANVISILSLIAMWELGIQGAEGESEEESLDIQKRHVHIGSSTLQ